MHSRYTHRCTKQKITEHLFYCMFSPIRRWMRKSHKSCCNNAPWKFDCRRYRIHTTSNLRTGLRSRSGRHRLLECLSTLRNLLFFFRKFGSRYLFFSCLYLFSKSSGLVETHAIRRKYSQRSQVRSDSFPRTLFGQFHRAKLGRKRHHPLNFSLA